MAVFKKAGQWIEDRSGLGRFAAPILRHKVPYTDWKDGWWYVLGSATLVAFVIQLVTGMVLATNFVTSTGDAYDSLKYITEQAPFGGLMRGMHYFGASAMVLLIGAHALHVFLIGSFKFPREMNWLSGVVLLLMTLAMGFTGQLLRWDQTAVWSVVVAASMASRSPFIGEPLSQFILAGNTVGGATLSRFFAFHVFFIPAIIFITLGFHLYLVIRNGVSEPPRRGDAVDPKTYRKNYHALLVKTGVPFWPDAVWRDAVFAVLEVLVIMGLALRFGAPELTSRPDPTLLEAYPRPDWYLLWFFSVLALIPAEWESAMILLGPLLVFGLMFALPLFANKGERAPTRRPWAVGIAFLIVIIIVPLWIAGEQSNWSPRFRSQQLPASVVNSTDQTVVTGSQLFYSKGCIYCHQIDQYGGQRGPNLTEVASRYTESQLIWRISYGGNGMPAYGPTLKPEELNALVKFLETRKGKDNTTSPQLP
jgi:ubiquinol-cytochrome c reductase cytochrome b subunit